MTTPYTVELTPAALADLDAAATWLANEAGVDVAERLLDAVLERVDTLEHFPARGAVPPELAGVADRSVRQISAPPFRLFYEVDGDRVFVFAVLHARRDLAALLGERLAR